MSGFRSSQSCLTSFSGFRDSENQPFTKGLVSTVRGTMEPSRGYQTTIDSDTFHPTEPESNDTAREAVGGEGLPAPEANGNASIPKLTVDGDTIKLDGMGPVVVNEDGSLSRITNWPQLTEREQEVAQRRIAKRNAERLERLRKKEQEETKENE